MNADERAPTLAPAGLLRAEMPAGRRCHPARSVGARSSAFICGHLQEEAHRMMNRALRVLLSLCPCAATAQSPPAAEPIELRVDAGHSLAEFSIPFLYG